MNIDGQNSLTRKRGLVDFSLHRVFAAKSCEKNNSAKVVAPLFLSSSRVTLPDLRRPAFSETHPRNKEKEVFVVLSVPLTLVTFHEN